VALGFFFATVMALNAIDWVLIVGALAATGIVAGLTILNSYYDKDESPVGGMQNPMAVNETLLWGALAVIFIAFAIGAAFTAMDIRAWKYVFFMFLTVFVYFFYSYEGTRWKRNGYAAVSINAFVGGTIFLGAAVMADIGNPAAGTGLLNGVMSQTPILLCALCAVFFKASVYSMMQVHQIEEDTARGDISFAVMHGRQTTLRFSQITFLLGGILATVSFFFPMGFGAVMLPSWIPALAALYFVGGLVGFEMWIRKEGDSHKDSLRMQRMIQYTGYLGTVSFAAVYVILLLLQVPLT
jgi:4-hydroxybenzoate polyprenyltransferase